jgi:hypothetical protein
MQQDDQTVVCLIAVIALGKRHPQAGWLLTREGELDVESPIPQTAMVGRRIPYDVQVMHGRAKYPLVHLIGIGDRLT